MKKTNVVLAIVLAIFIISAVVIMVMAIINNKKDDTVPVNIDFTALSSNIEESTDFDTARMESISLTYLESEAGINPEWVSNYIGLKPYVNVSSNMYVIIEATEGNVENVVKALQNYGESYDEMWKDYLTEEYELVKNRQIGSKGNYAYFIVSDYAKDIVDLIK